MSAPEIAPKYLVYGLVDPRTLIVEYTGKSSSGMTRPRAHRTKASLRHNSIKNTWLRDLFAAGLDYEIVILGSVEDPKAPGTLCWWLEDRNVTALNDLEIWHIAMGRALGCSMKNKTDGGGGSSGMVHSVGFRESKQRWANAQWADPEYRAVMSRRRGRLRPEHAEALRGQKRTTETRQKMSESRSRYWANRERVRKVVPCGTVAAYLSALRARRAGEDHCGPCADCMRASAAYARENRRRKNRVKTNAVLP